MANILKFHHCIIINILISIASFLSSVLSAEVYVHVDLCREAPTANYTPHCHCKENVINCDFSAVKPDKERHGIAINGWTESHNMNIKRLCFCGGPSNLHLFIGQNIFTGLRGLHRVDFYNIPGVVHFRNTMSEYFSGDIYMENVRLSKIYTQGFGSADYIPVEDVSGIQCCSKIETPKNLSRPVLHMENTKLGLVKEYGIDDRHAHRWRNVVLHKVSAMTLEKFAVAITSEGTNVSITNCKFNETATQSIVLRNFDNALLANNYFSKLAHPVTLFLESEHPGSNLFLFENDFHNSSYLTLDAKKVLVWFNRFQKWDHDDFYRADKTRNQGRIYAVQFNVFKSWSTGHYKDIDRPEQSIIFQENTLGPCSCANDYTNVSKIFLESRCELQSLHDSKKFCDPTIQHIRQKCTDNSTILKYESECHGEKQLGTTYMDYLTALNDFFKMHNSSLDSEFIPYVMHNHMGIQYAATATESKKKTSPNVAFILLGILAVGLCLGAIVVYISKRRKRYMELNNDREVHM